MTNCPTCGQALPEPAGARIVDGVTVESVADPIAPAVTFWRAQGRPELPLSTFPAQAAQLAKIRRPRTIGGVEVRPWTRNPGDPDEVRFWRAFDRFGRPHDAENPEAAALAAGARINSDATTAQ